MKVYSQLEVASLENLASDPSNLPEGRIWLNTTSGLVKQVIGGATKVIATADNTLTFTNKTLTAPVINSPTGIVKGDVGLGNVDNTSDVNKPTSTAQAASIATAVSTHAALTTTHGVAGTIVGTSDAQVLTNKDIDGGTASNTNRITIPKNVTANLTSLTRKAATILYDSTLNRFFGDNGTTLDKFAISPIPLATEVSGVLPEANGGTNQSTYSTGDILYASSANTLSKRTIGTTNQVLTVVGGVPSWVTPTGGAVAAGSASPSAASSVTISGLNGNSDKVWKIIVKGVWSGADSILMKIQPNADSGTNYNGTSYVDYNIGTRGIIWTSNDGAVLLDKAYANAMSVYINCEFHCETTGSPRPFMITAGYGDSTQPNGGFERSGGIWKNTSSNVTSLNIDFGGGTFTGTVNVYPSPV